MKVIKSNIGKTTKTQVSGHNKHFSGFLLNLLFQKTHNNQSLAPKKLQRYY